MLEASNNNELPAIPGKRYFTIGEVSELCGVKPHVLRYWEQEFSQLKPVKRRGNRRYYQRHDVVLIREIRGLLYDQGFTIGGARQQLGTPVAEAKSPEVALPETKQSQKELVRELLRELEDLRTLLN
jgi:DNA-binding transcriptional MerR regulator